MALVDADLSGRRNVAILLDAVRTFDANRSLGIYSIAEVGGLTAVELTNSLDNAFALRPDEIDAWGWGRIRLAKSYRRFCPPPWR